MSSVEERMMGLLMFLKVVPWLYIHICLIFSTKKISKRKELSGNKNLNFLSERSALKRLHRRASTCWPSGRGNTNSKEEWLPQGMGAGWERQEGRIHGVAISIQSWICLDPENVQDLEGLYPELWELMRLLRFVRCTHLWRTGAQEEKSDYN